MTIQHNFRSRKESETANDFGKIKVRSEKSKKKRQN